MKPRIKIYRFEGKAYWSCEGVHQNMGMTSAFGGSPQAAYEAWKAFWDIPF